jgi:ferrochelatase
MTHFLGNPRFKHDQEPCTGVLLVNLGTPEAPTPKAVRRFLAEFLWDPRVIEVARPLWWLILHGVILRIRPGKVSRAYKSIWTQEGSPLMVLSKSLTQAVGESLSARLTGKVVTALAMRYGQPSIEHVMNELREQGMRRLLVVPLYPQYSATTTASIYDEVANVLSRWRWVPELRFVQHYHDQPAFIAALANSVREHWHNKGRGERLIMSFHGIPKRYFDAGDPYFCECQKTARLLAHALELEDSEWQLTFQSRVGREQWLQPYTDYTLRGLPGQGVRNIDVVCPGFSVDCLETLEEIAEQNRDLFISSGGERLAYVPALNDRSDHVDALVQLIGEHIQGWDSAGSVPSGSLAECRERALALGASQ